jgi:hypothetical protein
MNIINIVVIIFLFKWRICETFFFYCGKKYFKYKKGLGNAHPAYSVKPFRAYM